MPLNTPSFTSGERGRQIRGAAPGPGAEARGGPLEGGHRLMLPHPPLVISDAYYWMYSVVVSNHGRAGFLRLCCFRQSHRKTPPSQDDCVASWTIILAIA